MLCKGKLLRGDQLAQKDYYQTWVLPRSKQLMSNTATYYLHFCNVNHDCHLEVFLQLINQTKHLKTIPPQKEHNLSMGLGMSNGWVI